MGIRPEMRTKITNPLPQPSSLLWVLHILQLNFILFVKLNKTFFFNSKEIFIKGTAIYILFIISLIEMIKLLGITMIVSKF